MSDNNSCKLYAIYANPEHMHFLVSRFPTLSEEQLASIVTDSSERFINQNKLTKCHFCLAQPFQYRNLILIKYVDIYLINPIITKK